MGDTTTPTPWPPTAARRPRVWPGILIVILCWVVLKMPHWVPHESALEQTLASVFDPLVTKMTGQSFPPALVLFMASMFGTMACFVAFLLWWLLLSRVRWTDRFLGLLACAAVGGVAMALFHPSLKGKKPEDGMFVLTLNVLPVVVTGWVVWMALSRSAARSVRTVGLVVVFLLTWGYFTTLRFEGMTGAFTPEFSFRWRPSAEEQFIAARAGNPSAPGGVAGVAGPVEVGPADWPGFRGPARDGHRTGVRIGTDWKQHPPKPLWRHRVGPGWSSVAVVGPRLFTQEQFGTAERVVCYDAATGAEVWAHSDETRHEDGESGAGPRGTPTVDGGRVYAFGATGRLNCLDAATGKKVWSRDVAAESGAKVPVWGFSASPLVARGVVTVLAGGPDGKSVLAYRADSGEPAWTAGNGTNSYASTQLVKLGGAEQLVAVTGDGMTAFDPAGGKVLWDYEWKMGTDFARVTQPAVVGDSDLLIGSGFDFGTRRVRVSRDGDKWKADQVWESRAISPYYNDLVVHKGHLYGFHSHFLTCVNLETGKGTWKERGYANGQMMLLADQDLLLVVTEKGEVALVEANPQRRKELGRFQAVEGKTWNHPVVAGRKLFVRNGEEMACYELPADDKAVAGR